MVLEGEESARLRPQIEPRWGWGGVVVRLLVAESSAGESPSFIKNYLEKYIIKLQSGSY